MMNVKGMMVLGFTRDIDDEMFDPKDIEEIIGFILDIDMTYIRHHNNEMVFGITDVRTDVPAEKLYVIERIFCNINYIVKISINGICMSRLPSERHTVVYNYKSSDGLFTNRSINSAGCTLYIEDTLNVESLSIIKDNVMQISTIQVNNTCDFSMIYLESGLDAPGLFQLLKRCHDESYTFSIFVSLNGKTIQLF